MVCVPPLSAVAKVMLPAVALAPSVVAAVSVVQSIAPWAISDAAPVAAVSVLPVMVVPAVSEAEPWAATEPCVATPLTGTVCASTKPLSAVTLTLPGSRPAPLVVIWLKVTFWLAWMVCVPPLSALPILMLPAAALALKVPLAPAAVPARTLSSVRSLLPSTSTLPLTADSRVASRSAKASR